jgi:hypothetical protein
MKNIPKREKIYKIQNTAKIWNQECSGLYEGCKTLYGIMNFAYDSNVSPEHKFQND